MATCSTWPIASKPFAFHPIRLFYVHQALPTVNLPTPPLLRVSLPSQSLSASLFSSRFLNYFVADNPRAVIAKAKIPINNIPNLESPKRVCNHPVHFCHESALLGPRAEVLALFGFLANLAVVAACLALFSNINLLLFLLSFCLFGTPFCPTPPPTSIPE